MDEVEDTPAAIRIASADPSLASRRGDLARYAADIFDTVGQELHVAGHIIGGDRVSGASRWGHGSDEAVAASVLLRIAAQLVGGSADLFTSGRHYAGAALIRQLVEVEYLAWAFEARDRDGERWLRSNREERESFFAPRKLRAAAGGRFRSRDYGYHCELGGHPVPDGTLLLGAEAALVSQLVLADALAGRFWDHMVGWARNSMHGTLLLARAHAMAARFGEWKRSDPLAGLPPPPDPPSS